MELSNIKLKTTWNDAATRINSNNQKIGQEIDKLKRATYKSKGYFPTYSQLMQFYPKASAGSIAYVGYTYPYVIWAWNDITESWENTGQYGGSETVSLENYYTKEETQKKSKSITKSSLKLNTTLLR